MSSEGFEQLARAILMVLDQNPEMREWRSANSFLPLQGAGLSHIRKHLEEEFFVPSSPLELGAHGGFGIGVSARNIQCQASQDSQVRRSVVFSRPGEILVEDNVSVQCKVFSMPQCWRTMPRSSAGL